MSEWIFISAIGAVAAFFIGRALYKNKVLRESTSLVLFALTPIYLFINFIAFLVTDPASSSNLGLALLLPLWGLLALLLLVVTIPKAFDLHKKIKTKPLKKDFYWMLGVIYGLPPLLIIVSNLFYL